MPIDGLFGTEENTIRHGEDILASEMARGNPLSEEYGQLLKNYKKMYKQLCRMVKINDKQQSRLSQANTILEIHSKYDALTGIFNRRVFNEMYEREWRRCIRYGHVLSVMMFDIDHFKDVNDIHGHQAGDDVLRITAGIIADSARREGDIAARYGGEEFILLLPDTPALSAFKMAESIRKSVSMEVFNHDGKDVKVTISAGLATMTPDLDVNPDRLVKRADEALYLAKRTGRNRVCIFEDVRAEGAGHAG
jgi:diguanylate cyclase (GGDEF)-like protein